MILNLLSLTWLLIVTALVVAIFRRALARRGEAGPTQCAACGTSAAAMANFACAGCGRDVREHGLVTPAARSPAVVFSRFATASGMVALAALLTYGLTLIVAPGERQFHADGQLRPSGSRAGAAPMPWDAIAVQADGRGGAVRPDDVGKPGLAVTGRAYLDIQLPDGRWSTMRVNWPSRRAQFRAPGGGLMTEAGDFDTAALRTWFASAGADVESADVRSRIEDLHAFLERLMTTGRFPDIYRDQESGFSWGGSSGGSTAEATWIWPAQLLVWPAVWLLAVMWMLRERSAVQGPGDSEGSIGGGVHRDGGPLRGVGGIG